MLPPLGAIDDCCGQEKEAIDLKVVGQLMFFFPSAAAGRDELGSKRVGHTPFPTGPLLVWKSDMEKHNNIYVK